MIPLLRGFYTAASGMIAGQRHQEMISNNLANVNTPGYKADQAVSRSFPELLVRQLGSKSVPTTNGGLRLPINRPVGALNTGVYVQEGIANFDQGPLRETGLGTDLAIIQTDLPDETGGVFFTVQHEDGDVRYTRDGHFTVDGEGFLTTNAGYYVLDEAGNPIQTNGLEFTVTTEGVVQAEGLNTPLGIVYIDNVHDLTKEDNDLFNLAGAEGEGALQAGANFTINQYHLEGSNVNPMQSMTEMMQSYRNFEMNQRVLRAYDQSMEKAVNDIGRLG